MLGPCLRHPSGVCHPHASSFRCKAKQSSVQLMCLLGALSATEHQGGLLDGAGAPFGRSALCSLD